MDLNWLWVVPVLGILIIVHEMGHFFTARWLGIKVEEFGIGFPPRAFAIRRGGVDYSLNWLPIGGFVKILGENGDSDDPASFGRAPAWKRIIVLAAGSFMNLLLAVLIFTLLGVMGTQVIDAPQTVVGTVVSTQPPQPAQAAGMEPGDRIISVAGQAVSTSDQVRALSKANAGKKTPFVVERGGKQVTLEVTPNTNPPGGTQYLGVGLSYFIQPAKVDQVRPGDAAAKAGIQPGDEVVQVNGKAVDNVVSALYELSNSDSSAQVTVRRNGSLVGPLTLEAKSGSAQSPYGFTLWRPYRTIFYSPLDALGRSLNSTWEVLSSVPRGIAEAIAGRVQGPGVTSIVGIGQLTGEVAQEEGVNGLLGLTALLGISLFMLNLLPLPALDGGRLLFILIELVRGGRRISPEKEGLVHFAGMVVLLALMAVITFFDVSRLLEGKCLTC